MNYFANELKAEWALMRQGRFTLDNLMKYVIQNQIDVIPAKYYNDDAQVKYLDFGSLYTYCCHGNKELLVKRWLRERIAYVDSMMGYFTSQDDQVTIRMNKTGRVEFTVTPYIPLYFSVKWSNAEGGTQTFKLKRGETKTFYYTSTTATDQEVIIYHAQYIKDLGNLSNLRPSSCILANAYKLNNIEIHSDELYNINVTANRYLRRLDLNGCTTLGTVTATGSVLDVSNCKYLSYLNIDNTALTGVLLNTEGGSLKEIYYPKTIQEVKLIKQTLLEKVGLPYGDNGEDIPTSLYTVDIQECPNIKVLNTSPNSEINKTWISMKYCQNLTVRNSLDYEQISLDGFQRLKILKLENMFKLKALGFDNMLSKGEKSTLQYMGVSYCPALEHITMNCTSNDYEITFADGALLNLGGATGLKSISSNCVIHGLETIVLPLSVEHLFFTNEYGEGYSNIKNIWSSRCCEINEEGILPVAIRYSNPDFIGMDLEGMKLKDIDLGALVNIPAAINFYLTPTSVNPNFNINRDGVEYPYLQPEGLLDLSYYTESLARFFNGVDLEKLVVMVDNPLPQSDLSYCFYNSTFTDDSQISPILDNLDTITNMEYCFYKTSVRDVSVLNNINFIAGTSMKYCFAECANISELKDITLSGNIGDASYMFSGCGVSTIDNLSTSCNNILGMFSNCPNLTSVTNFNASGTTSYESLFEGCTGMAVAPITSIPTSIVNIKNMYKNCDSLVSIDGFVLHGNITEVTGFIEGCDKLVNANNVTISGPFYNDIFRGITSIKYVNNLLVNYVGRSMSFAHMFDGCTSLVEMSFNDDSYTKDVISMDYMFRATSMRTVDFSNVNFEKVSSYRYMFADCIMEEFSYTVPETIISIEGFLSGCSNLKTLRNFYIDTNVSTNKWIDNTSIENLIDCRFNTQFTKFENYTSLKNVENLTYTGKDFSNYFNGCTSLKNATVNITNNATKAENTFANCTNLVSVDFTESDLSNINSINGMFASDTSLNTINNLKITNDSTIADNTTLAGCPIINTDGLYINSNNALDMFRMGENSNIVRITGFELGSSADDLHELFANYAHLTHDIVIPSHVSIVESMFYNCISLEYITSNWSNRYDLNVDSDPNNDVVTGNCYSECNNIKYIDNELYMNEYGELTAIYTIPEEWGGIANYEVNQTAFYINTELLTDNTITLNGSNGTYITDWGDGTKDKRVSHTYTKSGIFRIVTDNTETFGTGQAIPENFRTAITKVVHLDEGITNGANLFKGCSNLLSLKPLTNTFNMVHSMFENCGKIVNIDLSQCTISNSCMYMYNMFKNCSKVEIIKLPDIPTSVINLQECFCYCENLTSVTPLQIPDACTTINSLFQLCGSLEDISGFTFGSGITQATNWIPTNLKYANNVTIKNNNIKFNNIISLQECNNLLITNDVTNMSRLFENCSNLREFAFHDNCDLSRVTTMEKAFYWCSSLSVLDFKNFDISSMTNMIDLLRSSNNITCKNFRLTSNNCNYNRAFYYPKYFENIYIGNNNAVKAFGKGITYKSSVETITNLEFGVDVTDVSSMFEGCKNLTHDFIIPSTVTNCTNAFKGCTSMTHIHSNWDKSYANGITATDCYAGCTGITHCDGLDLGVNEYIKGLDDVPHSWGGYGLHSDYSTICVMNIPSDNFTMQLNAGGSTVMFDDAMIDWGDGSTTYNTNTHVYAKAGEYVIRGKYWFSNVNLPWARNIVKFIKGPYGITVSGFFVFSASSLLTYANISNMTINNGSSMFNMYQAATAGGPFLSEIVIKNTRILQGVAMNSFFATNPALEEIDVSGFVFEGNHNIESMFDGCRNLTTIRGLETWTDGTKFNSMKRMFYGCSKLTNSEVNFGDINFSNVTSMEGMFKDCTGLTELDLSNWNTSKVGSIRGMLSNCTYLTQVNLSGWDLSSMTTCLDAFNGCTSLQTANFSNWKNMNKRSYDVRNFLYNCTSLTSVNFTGWDTSTINNFEGMFRNCKLLVSLPINHFDFSSATNVGLMFASCENLEDFSFMDNFTFPKVTSFSSMFDGCKKLNYPPITTFGDSNRPTTSIGYSTLYQNTGVNCEDIVFRIVGACNLYRVFCLCRNFGTKFEVIWETEQKVSVTGLFCDSKSKISSLRTFNLTSCGDSLFLGYFFGGISGQNNNNLTTFECTGVLNNALNVSLYPNLTRESLLNIINCLCTTEQTLTLTVGTSNIARLSSSDIKIATDKGWTVA